MGKRQAKKPAYDRFYNRYAKRWLDLLIAVPFLLLALPLYAVIALLIWFGDGRPILYRPLRGGYHNIPFRIVKFRTMVVDADRTGGATAKNDPRVTKVGAFLRKTKLDETANLLNIVTGKMSFVGPRPELLLYTDQYTGEERKIFEVRPGVTDYSSLEFINQDEILGEEDPVARYEELILKRKNELRIRYAETVSFRTDAILFFRTIGKVMQKAIAVMAGKR